MGRKSIKEIEPGAYKAMLGLEKYMEDSIIPPLLLELIKIRASQINRCAYCIDMHTQHALSIGESQRRIFALPAWEESPLFTNDEKAVLQLTEEITLISQNAVSDKTYAGVLNVYGEQGLAQIITQVIIINAWNRIAISTQQVFEYIP